MMTGNSTRITATRTTATRLTATLCAALGVLAAVPAPAQDAWPNRPIRFLVPAAPGGTTDGLSRIVSARLTETLKQQVLADNRASSSGVLAGEIAKAAAPDGHTLFMAYHQHTVNAALNAKLPYHPVNDFTPITQLTEAGLLLVVHPGVPAKTFKEFLEWTKTTKKPLNFGSAGHGSGGHLAGELYNLIAGIKAQHIPYKGTGPAIADLLAGQYDYNFAGLLGVVPLHRAGKLRGLAVTSATRVEALSEIPTAIEAGLPGFEVVGWYGVLAPPKMAKPLLARIHKEITAVIREPETTKRVTNLGGTIKTNDPESFRKFLLADMAKWQDVVKKSGAKLD